MDYRMSVIFGIRSNLRAYGLSLVATTSWLEQDNLALNIVGP